jgi:hypothetical protein
MDIKICCEWCGKVIKSVKTFEAVRDAQQKKQDICPLCQKKVMLFERFLHNQKEAYKKSLDRITKEFKDEFREKIAKGDFSDVHTDTRDVGRKTKNV